MRFRGTRRRKSVVRAFVLSDHADWPGLLGARSRSREVQAEGLMLKKLGSAYEVRRQRGDRWKWKVNPYIIDAILTAAQPGNGKRASLYTDYTFSVWDRGQLVLIAKAYSGLTDAEIRRVDAWVRRHIVERFGPVRTVRPELAFEGIQRFKRHKSGVAVQFPRILRWSEDKPAAEADSLDSIKGMLPPEDHTAPDEREGPERGALPLEG